MAAPFVQNPAFTVGEISPTLYGRVDLARFGVACTTGRNAVVAYQGGLFSRGGTKFVGFSKQTGRNYPPRMITFQFAINDGLALEFGNFYMRVIQNGAFVTEGPFAISAISQSSPAVISLPSATGATAATANIGAVAASYAPGDLVTLAGGTYSDPGTPTPTVLGVTNTTLASVLVNTSGVNYAPGDTVELSGGTQTTPPEVTVVTTTVVAKPTIVNAGAGGTPGPAVVTGTTGTGTPFQATVTIDGTGVVISVDVLTVAGSYTVNPTVPAAEPVTGGGLVGAELGLALGIESISLTTPGEFTLNASAGAFSQASTSGVGTGATFRNGIFAPNDVSVETAGRYSAYPGNPVAQATTTGTGTGADFTVTSAAVAPYDDGDWIAISGILGMTELNGQTFVARNPTATSVELFDIYGSPIDSSSFLAYIGSGEAARIYTLVTPYAEADLRYLKSVQSNDVMSLCLVNPITLTEYAPIDLARNSNTDWSYEVLDTEPTIEPPSTMSGTASAGGTTNYQYVVTAVDPENGTESVASPIARINGAVNIAATAGTITLTWSPVANVKQYNVYKAQPGTGAAVPVGALFGFAGSAYGTQFIDANIVADFSQVPPKHADPFFRGQVIGAEVVTGGAGYTTITLTVVSATGTGAQLVGVIVGGALSAVIVENAGRNYIDTDTITITGDGAGAAATLTVGAQTGTYPSVPSYFQQRRVYANTLNRPNTYFMSQPGAYTNFDTRIPTIDTDAITGNPWAVQLNGIQFMIQQPGGLVVFTGKQAWQLTGNGGSSFNPQPITPSSQDAQPQAFNGCSPTIAPVSIDNENIYYDPYNGRAYDFSYQFYQNSYTGTDLTLNCSHLFTGYSAVESAWCREPYKVLWEVRTDGIMLSLTYNKPQEVAGWTRHDTEGLFKSVCSVTEPPVDALYMAVQRFPGVHTAYMIERMDNRIWGTVEDAWCVDAGLRLAQPEPAAVLTASSATGAGIITSIAVTAGGENYSASTTARIVDDGGEGSGTGCTLTPIIVDGVITTVTVDTGGADYSYPAVVFEDPENSGNGAAAATAGLDTSATFTASASVFPAGVEGRVIRMGGGVAEIMSRVSGTQVVATITSPITVLIPNTRTPQPAASGNWTMTAPVSSVGPMNHLAGATITGTYDGHALEPTVVPESGVVELPAPASAVTLGLGFGVQIQSNRLNTPGQITAQGQRKAIEAVTIRVAQTRGGRIGTNQPDGATLSPPQIAPAWSNMVDVPEKARMPYNSTTLPLYTGDIYAGVTGGFDTPGQVAIDQMEPLPLTVLAFVPVVLPGDEPESDPRPQRGAQQE